MTIKSELADASEALRFLLRHKNINSRRLGLLGLSMGAAVASYLAGREHSRFKSISLWAPVAEGTGILDQLSTPDAVSALAETGITDHGGNLVGVSFIRQFAEMKPVRELMKSKCPVLLIHGTKDETVPAHHSDLYEKALVSHKRVVKNFIIPGADHTFNKHIWERRSDYRDSRLVAGNGVGTDACQCLVGCGRITSFSMANQSMSAHSPIL